MSSVEFPDGTTPDDIELLRFDQLVYRPRSEDYEPPDGHDPVGDDDLYQVADPESLTDRNVELVEGIEADAIFNHDLVANLAGVPSIGNLKKDRQLAHHTYRAIKRADAGRFLATPDGEIYVYRDGVWHGEPEGKQRLRELGQQGLGQFYGENVLRELEEQVRAIDTVPREQLGSPRGMIPLANGLYDVETGELRDPRSEDHVLSPLPVGYNPDAEPVEWDGFVEEVAEEGMVDALQEFVGYCLLVNEWRFDRVLLLLGTGSNGKTTFLNAVTELLGRENVTGFSVGDLAHDEYTRAQMFGATANIDADVTGGLGGGGMFKKLTGGDRKVSARHPYGRPFDFEPTTKQLYAANEVPDTNVDDNAFFRRWLMVEFPNEYTDPEQPGPDKDPELEDRLLCELPGVLSWAIDGLERLLEQGHFTNEGDTEEKRHRWQSWGDTVDKFISNAIEIREGEKHTAADVHERYKAYCFEALEQTPESQSTLTSELKKVEGIRYSTGFRFDGRQQRGFKGLGFAWTPGDSLDAEDALDQGEAYELILETIRDLEGVGGAPVDDVIDAVTADVGGRDRAEHLIEQLRQRGQIYEPEDGVLRAC